MTRVVFMCGPAGSGKTTYTGVVPETVYLATDRATVLRRLRGRRGTNPDDAVLTEEQAARFFGQFQQPSPQEGLLIVVDG